MNRTPASIPPVPLQDLARHVIETQGWDTKALQVLDLRWQIFVRFVLAAGAVPELPLGINERTLADFAEHCDVDGAVAFEEAPVVLGAVRLVLFRAGFDAQAVAALRAPRRRQRGGYKKGILYKSARPE
ncbi:hypothetical protein SAMN05446935_2501 [Burkholderia sp. YR290]|nr:hypothetical protein SAMN05446935_2501 [Burkholderia sp. YR290]